MVFYNYMYEDRVFEVFVKNKSAYFKDIYFKNKGVDFTGEEQVMLMEMQRSGCEEKYDKKDFLKLVSRILTKEEVELISQHKEIRKQAYDSVAGLIKCPKQRKEINEKDLASQNISRKIFYAYRYNFNAFNDKELLTEDGRMSEEVYNYVMRFSGVPKIDKISDCVDNTILVDPPKLTDEEYDLLFRNRCILDSFHCLLRKNLQNCMSHEERELIIEERRKLAKVFIKTRTYPIKSRAIMIGDSHRSGYDYYETIEDALYNDCFVEPGKYFSSSIVTLKDSILIAALQKKYDLKLNIPFKDMIFDIRFFEGDDPKKDFYEERLPGIFKELDKAVVYLNTLDEEKIKEICSIELPRVS